jgi:DNA-binding winged helix-turn-helix (wHTH) protein
MSLESNNLYEFEGFRIDLSERTLRFKDEPIPLAPKVMETLCVLVENQGRLMTKDDLMNEIWRDTFVEERNLTQNIFTLRKIFKEKRKDSKFIETIPRRGYRFVADFSPLESLQEETLD